MKVGPYKINTIYTGDARELCAAVPDESVDLVFADPVYDRIEDYAWLARLAGRVLKPHCSLLVWQHQKHLEATMAALSGSGLAYRWLFAWYAPNNMQMNGMIGRKLAPLLWYERSPATAPFWALREVCEAPIPNGKPEHPWAKPPKVVSHYLERFALTGHVVLDPFCGGGTVPVACKTLGRNFLAFEIDPQTAERARERVRLTTPPLPFPEPEQLTLAEGRADALR